MPWTGSPEKEIQQWEKLQTDSCTSSSCSDFGPRLLPPTAISQAPATTHPCSCWRGREKAFSQSHYRNNLQPVSIPTRQCQTEPVNKEMPRLTRLTRVPGWKMGRFTLCLHWLTCPCLPYEGAGCMHQGRLWVDILIALWTLPRAIMVHEEGLSPSLLPLLLISSLSHPFHPLSASLL